jgi:hypothetical protein
MPDRLIVRPVTASDWPRIAAEFGDLGFEQTASYAEPAAARIGASVDYLVIEDAGRAVAAAALRVKTVPGLKRGIAWCPGGPLTRPKAAGAPADPAAVLRSLKTYVTGELKHVLRIRLPVLAGVSEGDMADMAGAAGFVPCDRAAAYQTVLVDLDRDEESLMSSLHGKWRSPLRATLKAGIALEEGSYNDFYDRFRILYDEVQEAKGFDPVISPAFYRNVTGLDFDHRILIATHEGQDLGAITVGLAGQGAVYLFGATAEAGRSLNAGYYLTWQGFLMARSRGCTAYDLGGIDPEDNPTVTRFKRRTNGEEARATPWEARPAGLSGATITGLEALRAKLKRRGG